MRGGKQLYGYQPCSVAGKAGLARTTAPSRRPALKVLTFPDEEMKAQKGKVTCLRSYSLQAGASGFKFRPV